MMRETIRENLEDVRKELEDVGRRPEQELRRTEKERSYSPQGSGSRRWRMSEGGDRTARLLRKLIDVEKIPIKKEMRILELVGLFNDFPWAQDVMMAAYQLEDVLVAYLWRHLNINSDVLHK